MAMRIKYNSRGVIIPVPTVPMPDFRNLVGFVPNIINAVPITNLLFLLGIADPNPRKEKPVDVSYNLSPLPMELRKEF